MFGLYLPFFVVSTYCYGLIGLPYPLEWERKNVSIQSNEPKTIEGYLELYEGSKIREMELSHFDNDENTIGYEPNVTFQVPERLRSRVNFWKQIYAKYTSDEAIIHDSEHPEIIYDVVNIKHIMKNTSLSYRSKIRRINKYLKSYKKRIIENLKFLNSIKDNPLLVPFELFHVYKKFEKINNPNKYLEATKNIRTQIGQRDKIIRGFFFGGRYFDKIKEVFSQKKLPQELSRLPLIESAFNLSARSRLGASGVWQFMRSTGKKFLRINKFVDERNDPIIASKAAAELLLKNFETLGSWPLAITAYNHGRSGIAKAVSELSTTDICTIIENYKARRFGFASRNFYAEFLAILEIEREYRKYFGKLMVDSPIFYVEFLMKDNVMFDEMTNICSISEEELALLNPALSNKVISGKLPIPKGYLLKIPPEKESKCLSGYRNVTSISDFRY